MKGMHSHFFSLKLLQAAKWTACSVAFAICTWSVSAQAAHYVLMRPLEKAPFTREVPRLVSVGMDGRDLGEWKGKARIEGSGVVLTEGKAQVFDVELPAGRGRTLELQLGYLTDVAELPKGAECPVRLHVEGVRNQGEPERRDLDKTVPLRSVLARAAPFAALTAWDYLMPSQAIAIDDRVVRLRLSVTTTAGCTKGKVLLFDPKVWAERPGKAHRAMFLTTDSIGGEWFDESRSFAPSVRNVFEGQGAFATNVLSVSTNTLDTSRILSRMRLDLSGTYWGVEKQRSDLVRWMGEKENMDGLIPAFLNAGYDVLSWNSNPFLTSLLDPIGFRNVYVVDKLGSDNNERAPEWQLEMVRDWSAKHVGYDVLFWLWFDATHPGGVAPRKRPGLKPASMPKWTENKEARSMIEQMGSALSYVDLAVDGFEKAGGLRDLDVLFFTDHGINFDGSHGPGLPDWAACETRKIAGNNLLYPDETRIPVGLRLASGKRLPPPKAKSSLIDWVRTFVKLHNADIARANWEGVELDSTPNEPRALLSVVKERGALYQPDGHIVGFSQMICPGQPGPPIVSIDYHRAASRFGPASSEQTAELMHALGERELLKYRAYRVDVLSGQAPCTITIEDAFAVNARGEPAPKIAIPSGDWLTTEHVYIPELAGVRSTAELRVSAEPKGCGTLQVGRLSRRLNKAVELSHGFEAFSRHAATDMMPGALATVRIQREPTEYALHQKKLTALSSGGAGTDKTRIDEMPELKAAMKRWGYIQDDGH
jgi:hypothetical protein